MRLERFAVHQREWLSLAVAASLFLCVSSCAGGGSPYGDSPYGSPSPASETTASSSPAGESAGPETPGADTATPVEPAKTVKPAKKPKKNVIKWTLGLGVGSPEGPAFDYLPSYTALSEGDCAAADDNDQNEALKYVVAAAKACQAAKGESADQDADWAAARAVRDSSTPLGCVDAVVFSVLDSLVDAHDQHPDRQFTFVPGKGNTGEPRCPEISSVEPTEAAAGDVVTFRGVNLGDVTGVTLFDQDVEVIAVEDTSVEIRVPSGQSETIDLVVDSPRNQWQLLAHLKILPGSAETPNETPAGSGGA